MSFYCFHYQTTLLTFFVLYAIIVMQHLFYIKERKFYAAQTKDNKRYDLKRSFGNYEENRV